MSQMAPEPAPARASTPGRGNVFTRKIGPLPMWVWLLIGVALIGLYVVFRRNQASQAQPTANASQVPQFVNQVYTNGVPPPAPQPGTTPTCPKGQAWDPDEGKCVPEGKHKKKKPHRRGHKGREAPAAPAAGGTGVTTINPGTAPGGGPTGPADRLPPTFFPMYVPPAG